MKPYQKSIMDRFKEKKVINLQRCMGKLPSIKQLNDMYNKELDKINIIIFDEEPNLELLPTPIIKEEI